VEEHTLPRGRGGEKGDVDDLIYPTQPAPQPSDR